MNKFKVFKNLIAMRNFRKILQELKAILEKNGRNFR